MYRIIISRNSYFPFSKNKFHFFKKKIKWKSEKSSTSQKKIYNKRYGLNFRIRKPTVPRWINYLKCGIFLNYVRHTVIEWFLLKTWFYHFFRKNSTLPTSCGATCENYATPIFSWMRYSLWYNLWQSSYG